MDEFSLLRVRYYARLLVYDPDDPDRLWRSYGNRGISGLRRRKCAPSCSSVIGPNRVGPYGLFQLVADGMKFFFKEESCRARRYASLSDRPVRRHFDRLARLCRRSVRPRRADAVVVGVQQPCRIPSEDESVRDIVSVRHRSERRHRHSLRFRSEQPGGVRHHPGGLGVEQQVQHGRRTALERPGHQLRNPAGSVRPGRGAAEPAR